MDRAQFEASLAADAPPAVLAPLLRALWHEARGSWSQAHQIVQAQDGPQAARVHAYLHRKEGDLSNADYWYERAGTRRPEQDLATEWQGLVDSLLAQP